MYLPEEEQTVRLFRRRAGKFGGAEQREVDFSLS
jgi:hypothetical protein